MRAAMLLIVILAASFSAHAEKITLRTTSFSMSNDGGNSYSPLQPCEMWVIIDTDQNSLFIDSDVPQYYGNMELLEQHKLPEGDGDYYGFAGWDKDGNVHAISFKFYQDYVWIIVHIDDYTELWYRAVSQ